MYGQVLVAKGLSGLRVASESCFDRGLLAPYHAPAMANPLLDRAAPGFLAGRKQVIEVVEKITTFERLAAIVQDDLAALPETERPDNWRESSIEVLLEFGWADSREQLPQLKVAARAEVPAVCQRCLDACTVGLQVDVTVLLLQDPGVEHGGDETLEVWELTESTLRPIDVVEELLVMALPMAAMHSNRKDCSAVAEAEMAATEDKTADTVRPFAGLRARIDESR